MSEDQLKSFLCAIKADPSLHEKLNSASSYDAAVEIAKAAGFVISVEDLKGVQAEELSQEELEEGLECLQASCRISNLTRWNC